MEEKATVILTQDQKKPFIIAAHDAWDAIAPDIGESMKACGDRRSSISAAEVEELVADADHIETHGNLTKDEIAMWRKLTYKQRHEILKSAFGEYAEWEV